MQNTSFVFECSIGIDDQCNLSWSFCYIYNESWNICAVTVIEANKLLNLVELNLHTDFRALEYLIRY